MRPSSERRAAWVSPRGRIGSRGRVGYLIGRRVRERQPVRSGRRRGGALPKSRLCRAGMAAPGSCADGLCCSHSDVRQTLDEMDFERGEVGAEPEVAPGSGEMAASGRKELVRSRPLETPTGAQGRKLGLSGVGVGLLGMRTHAGDGAVVQAAALCGELTFLSLCVIYPWDPINNTSPTCFFSPPPLPTVP